MDFSQVKSLTIPEGNVTKIQIGGTTVWQKEPPIALIFLQTNISAGEMTVDADTFLSVLRPDIVYEASYSNGPSNFAHVFVKSVDGQENYSDALEFPEDVISFFAYFGINNFCSQDYDIGIAKIMALNSESGFHYCTDTAGCTVDQSTFESNANVANGDKFLFEITDGASRIIKNGEVIWHGTSHSSEKLAEYGVSAPQATEGNVYAVTFEKPTGN